MTREEYLVSLLQMAADEGPWETREELVVRAMQYSGAVVPRIRFLEMNEVLTAIEEDREL